MMSETQTEQVTPGRVSKYPILMDELTKNIFAIKDRLDPVLDPICPSDIEEEKIPEPNDAEFIERLAELGRITRQILDRLAL